MPESEHPQPELSERRSSLNPHGPSINSRMLVQHVVGFGFEHQHYKLVFFNVPKHTVCFLRDQGLSRMIFFVDVSTLALRKVTAMPWC